MGKLMGHDITKRSLLGTTLALAASPAMATTPSVFTPVTGKGWQEAVVHVANPGPWVEFFTQDAGWQAAGRGGIDRSVIAAWGLPASVSGSEVILRNPGDDKGWVRLITLTGANSQPIRPAAQAWDPGGWFSLMTRSRDATALYNKAIARGWTAYNSPQEFNFGGVALKNVVIRGPDGVNIAIYERVSPKLVGWETITGISRVFNVMTMVADFEAERKFFQDGLGFGAWFVGDYEDTTPVATNFGLPVNLSTTTPRRSAILWESEGEDGRVEVMRFVGLEGVDQSQRSTFANRGIVSVRIPVADINVWAARARAKGIEVRQSSDLVTIAPYGRVRHAWVRSPHGNLVEAFQTHRP
ncbi:MAG: VOC family protein [Hyphomonadaceae bacterium]|nr:VOC family protein [Hyphomonadaceae bacterium]